MPRETYIRGSSNKTTGEVRTGCGVCAIYIISSRIIRTLGCASVEPNSEPLNSFVRAKDRKRKRVISFSCSTRAAMYRSIFSRRTSLRLGVCAACGNARELLSAGRTYVRFFCKRARRFPISNFHVPFATRACSSAPKAARHGGGGGDVIH